MIWRLLYSLFRTITLPWQLFGLWQRSADNPAFKRRWSERLGRPTVSLARRDRPLVWVHAPSESQARDARILIHELQRTLPDLEYLVTTTSPAASVEVQRWEPGVLHQYMPFDLVCMLRPLFRHYRPRMVLLMEKDVWPNLVHTANQQQVPIVLMNGRLTQSAAMYYQQFAPLTRPAFAGLSQVMAQSPEDQQRFIELGAHPSRTQITGIIEYDLSLSAKEQKILPILRSQYENRQFLVAGHLHPGEEGAILDAYRHIRDQFPDLVLVLHGKRCKPIKRKLEERGLAYARYQTELPADTPETIWLLDSPTNLRVFYSLAKVVMVGGSWVDQGGEQLVEPAVLGIPIIIGPSTYCHPQLVGQLKEAGALKVSAASNLADNLTSWLENDMTRRHAGKAGEAVIQTHQGAKRRQAYGIQQLIG